MSSSAFLGEGSNPTLTQNAGSHRDQLAFDFPFLALSV